MFAVWLNACFDGYYFGCLESDYLFNYVLTIWVFKDVGCFACLLVSICYSLWLGLRLLLFRRGLTEC